MPAKRPWTYKNISFESRVTSMKIWDLHCHPEGDRVPGRTLSEKVENLLRYPAG